MNSKYRFLKRTVFSLVAAVTVSGSAVGEADKTLIDFFQPFESKAPLVSEGIWGAPNVIPRDVNNGLEDPQMKSWCYWDGNIFKDDEGKYHMYACHWDQKYPHGIGWTEGSKGIHAVSDSLYGPYKDLGDMWPQWNESKGANVIGLRLKDGRYAAVASEIVPGEVFVSDNPNGPFELLGDFQIDPNGYYAGWGRYNELDDGAANGGSLGHLANVMIILRPDGRYMMIARHCVTMISDDGVLGPYKMYSDKAWLGVEGLPQHYMEDPTVWYSDGLYHIVVNFHGKDTTYHITSEDGIHNWKNRGLAFKRHEGVFRHKDGTIEDWFTVQRPTVYVENGLVKAFNFSVIDVHKGQDQGNDNHGSKIIVVPFDGAGFQKHMKTVMETERELVKNTPLPSPLQSTNIGAVDGASFSGYDKVVDTIEIHSSGNDMSGQSDSCRYVWKKVSGDFSAEVMVMSHDVSEHPVDAGLMLRKTLDDDSECLFASISKLDGFALKERKERGTLLKTVHRSNIAAPYWIRYVKRGEIVTTYISTSNRKNWDKIGENKIEPGDSYYVGIASSSGDSNIVSRARFKNLDIHSYGEPLKEGITRHTFPDKIPASGVVDFEVEIESVRALDVWVELQNVQTLEKHKVLRKRCWKSGIYQLTYDAGTTLDPDATYWFVIKAIPMHFHDSEHVDSAFKKVSVEK